MKNTLYTMSLLALMVSGDIALAHGPGGGTSTNKDRSPGIRFNTPPANHEPAIIHAQPIMEMSIEGKTVYLKISDADGKPIDAEFADARTFITAGGKISSLHLWPAGGNVLSGTGDFTPEADLRIEVKLNLPDREPVSKDFYPFQ